MHSQKPQKNHPAPSHRSSRRMPPGSEKVLCPNANHGEQSYHGTGKLKNKVALITGGDSGIGRAVAVAFAREGADLLISYLNETEDAETTADLVRKAGRKCITVSGDIGKENHCQALVARCTKELGHLDILVNNAAYQALRNDIRDISSEEFDYTFKTNIYSIFYLCKAALPHLPPGGAIINVSSIQAYQPSPALLAYAATKGAIVTFTRALAQKVIKEGVRVNAVAPGPIWTPLVLSTFPQELIETLGQDTPIGRPGQPAELAPTFVFLASEDSSYIVGQVIGVTGGWFLG